LIELDISNQINQLIQASLIVDNSELWGDLGHCHMIIESSWKLQPQLFYQLFWIYFNGTNVLNTTPLLAPLPT
jgi:hypothetical protein